MLIFAFCLLFQLPPVQITQVQRIPDPVQAEGVSPVIDGACVWLWLAPREGMDAQRFDVRLSGISAPEPSGSITTQLAQDSATVLDGLLDNQFVEVSCSRSEQVAEWSPLYRRWLDRSRLVCSVKLQWLADGGKFVPAKPSDVSLEMLRRGRAWLRGFGAGDVWRDEIADGDELAYYLAQSEARAQERGFWPWAGASWPFGARPERLPADRQMPARRR